MGLPLPPRRDAEGLLSGLRPRNAAGRRRRGRPSGRGSSSKVRLWSPSERAWSGSGWTSIRRPCGPAGPRRPRHRGDVVAAPRAVARVDDDGKVRPLPHDRRPPRGRACCAWRSRRSGCPARRGSPARFPSPGCTRPPRATPRSCSRGRASGGPAGRPSPTAFRSGKFCMFRAPIWRMSAFAAMSRTCSGAMTSLTIGMPNAFPAAARSVEPLLAEPLERVGARPRLEDAARGGCGRRSLADRLRRRLDLLLRLDRAGPRHDDEAVPPIRRSPTRTTVSFGAGVAVDELVLDSSSRRGRRPSPERGRHGPPRASRPGGAIPDVGRRQSWGVAFAGYEPSTFR